MFGISYLQILVGLMGFLIGSAIFGVKRFLILAVLGVPLFIWLKKKWNS